MSLCKTITLDYEEEMKNTRKMLERVVLNDETGKFRPHEKSMTFAELTSHVAEAPSWISLAIRADAFDLPLDFKPWIAAGSAELLEKFDKSVSDSREDIAGVPDEAMAKQWNFTYGGQPVFGAPRQEIIRSFLNHVIHHRAQLGVYLRLMNTPVPGMYGPSADEGDLTPA